MECLGNFGVLVFEEPLFDRPEDMFHFNQVLFLQGLLAVDTTGPFLVFEFLPEVEPVEILLLIHAVVAIAPVAGDEGVHAGPLDPAPIGPPPAHLLDPELPAEQQIGRPLLVDLEEQDHLPNVNASRRHQPYMLVYVVADELNVSGDYGRYYVLLRV